MNDPHGIVFLVHKKWIKRSCWTVGILLAVSLPLLVYKDGRKFICGGCRSQLVRNQWRGGMWDGRSFPISSEWEQESHSHLFDDYIPAGHRHDWEFVQGSGQALIFGGCSVGRGSMGCYIAELYEKDPRFRSFIKEKVEKGDLSRTDFLAAALLPQDPLPAEKAETRFQQLETLGKKLDDEFSKQSSPR